MIDSQISVIESQINGATIVRVRDLPLLADIGINPDEIGRRQPLMISVDVHLGPLAVDAIGQTVDYRWIVRVAEKLATAHIPLIESFAWQLCRECLTSPNALAVRVSIDKPFALKRGLAGVEVTLRRPPGNAHP